ncbi:MAG: hypothetical protein GY815_02870 [Gammaproteobacteria bacterium]|nr:hypothetical protein [Gammaproteobacteria bacterium]
MRNLDEITAAVRTGLAVTDEEMRRAIVAYDVLLAQFDLPRYPALLAEYFLAGETDVKVYAGSANDYSDPAAREWYRDFHAVDIMNGD